MSWTVKHEVKMASVDHTEGDELMKALATDANNKGATRYPKGDCVVYDIYEEFAMLDMAKAIVVGGHGDVHNYRLFIEIDSVDSLVPAELFGSTDEEGEALTWAQWCSPNAQPTDIDGRLFVNTSAKTGELPSMSELVPVFDSLFDLKAIPRPQETLDE